MANYYLDGDDFTVVTDWQTLAGAAAAEYPGQNQADDIVFGAWAAAALTVNVNQSANPNGITNVTVDDRMAYAIGSATAPLYLKVAGAATWTFKGSSHGDIYIVNGTAAITALNILKTSSSSDALHLAFSHAVTAANITGGIVWFDDALFGVSSAGVGTLNCSKQSGSSQPTLRLLAPVTTALTNRGGKVFWNAGTLTLVNQYSGTLTGEESATARTLTNANVYSPLLDLRTGIPDIITVTNPIAMFTDSDAVQFTQGQTISFT